jgi:hypothetical protein
LGWALDFISLNYLPAIMLVLMLAIVVNSFALPPALKEIEPFGEEDEEHNVDRL